MKGFSRGVFTSCFMLFIVKIFNSVNWCDAGSSIIGANSVKSLFNCEDQIMHMTCPHKSLSISIMSAKYGRLLSETHLCQPSSKDQVLKDCGESNVKANIKKLCNGKTECSFNVDNRNLGAFCVNVYKYIRVVYKCVVRPTTKEPPTTTPLPTSKPTTAITTSPMSQTQEPNTNLSKPKTSKNTYNTSSSTSEVPAEQVESTKEATKVTPKTKRPIVEVYDRDVFSRGNSAPPTSMTSGHYGIVVSMLVLMVLDAHIFRVT